MESEGRGRGRGVGVWRGEGELGEIGEERAGPVGMGWVRVHVEGGDGAGRRGWGRVGVGLGGGIGIFRETRVRRVRRKGGGGGGGGRRGGGGSSIQNLNPGIDNLKGSLRYVKSTRLRMKSCFSIGLSFCLTFCRAQNNSYSQLSVLVCVVCLCLSVCVCLYLFVCLLASLCLLVCRAGVLRQSRGAIARALHFAPILCLPRGKLA